MNLVNREPEKFPDQMTLEAYQAQMRAKYPNGVVTLTGEPFDDAKLRLWHEASQFAATIVDKRERRKRKRANAALQTTLF
jgi:hypothetical protein